ncbi:MAG: peptide-methionine (R)-S-oxide reductase [Deinococcales bacterium]
MEWQERLTSEQYQVLRQEGTERKPLEPLNHEHRSGTFICAACSSPFI